MLTERPVLAAAHAATAPIAWARSQATARSAWAFARLAGERRRLAPSALWHLGSTG